MLGNKYKVKVLNNRKKMKIILIFKHKNVDTEKSKKDK